MCWKDRKLCGKLTVVVQSCGPCDQHEEEKRCKAEAHTKQLCRTERGEGTRDLKSVLEAGRSTQTSLMLLETTAHAPGSRPFCRAKRSVVSSNSVTVRVAANRWQRRQIAVTGFGLERTHFPITCQGDHMRGRRKGPRPMS